MKTKTKKLSKEEISLFEKHHQEQKKARKAYYDFLENGPVITEAEPLTEKETLKIKAELLQNCQDKLSLNKQ